MRVAPMRVEFTKVSDRCHALRVERRDGTTESVALDSRSVLRHDLAHFAVELEPGLAGGAVRRGDGARPPDDLTAPG